MASPRFYGFLTYREFHQIRWALQRGMDLAGQHEYRVKRLERNDKAGFRAAINCLESRFHRSFLKTDQEGKENKK